MDPAMALPPSYSVIVAVVIGLMMLWGCTSSHESRIRFAHSLRQRQDDPAPSPVATFTLRDGGQVRLIADSMFNATYMVATDNEGHAIDVASVFLIAAENDRFTAQFYAMLHTYHLLSMHWERASATYFNKNVYALSRACYASIACLFALLFIEYGSQIDAGASAVERAMAVCYVVGGVVASILIVATYIRIMFTKIMQRRDTRNQNVPLEADLNRCTEDDAVLTCHWNKEPDVTRA